MSGNGDQDKGEKILRKSRGTTQVTGGSRLGVGVTDGQEKNKQEWVFLSCLWHG